MSAEDPHAGILASNRAVTRSCELIGWLVDSPAVGRRVVNRDGVPIVPEKQDDGTVLIRHPDGSTTRPRPPTEDDPFELDVDADGNVVVIVDGQGNRLIEA